MSEADVTVKWEGLDQIGLGLQAFAEQCREATLQIVEYFAPILETFAKENAPWEDQTGNARQSLQGIPERLSQDAVALYLAHGMNYGVYLETRWAGKYAILWPTIEAHLGDITEMLRQVFGS